jgi:hypothetical protein
MRPTEIVDYRPRQGIKNMRQISCPSEIALIGKSSSTLSTYTHYSQREKVAQKEKVTTTKSQLRPGNI